MDLTTLTSEQSQIVTSDKHKIVVIACAAAGKTYTLISRIQFLLDSGVDPSKIVAITFTNAASSEILSRLNHPKGIFIGTIHAYANYLLRSSGIDTTQLLVEEQFDQLFPLVKTHMNCIQPVEYLLLDEAQDSTPEHFEFLIDMIQPSNYMLVGDYRQSIYRWNNADPQYLLQLMRQPDVTTYSLTKNYRNRENILSFAKSIILQAGYDYRDDSVAMQEGGRVVTVTYSPRAIVRTIKKMGNYKDWFILTRTNAQADEIMGFLAEESIPSISFKRAQLTNTEIYEKIQTEKVKVLTIHTSKGLEAKNVVVIGAKFYNIEEKCISYVAATRAKDLLVWATMPTKPRRMRMVENWE